MELHAPLLTKASDCCFEGATALKFKQLHCRDAWNFALPFSQSKALYPWPGALLNTQEKHCAPEALTALIQGGRKGREKGSVQNGG